MALLTSLYLFVLMALMVIGVPVAVAMIAAAATYMSFRETMPFIVIPHKMIAGIDIFSLLAIPFFLIVGEILKRAKLAELLVDFAVTLVGRVRGGEAHACIVSGVMMGAVSGVAVADTALLSSVFIPSMKRRGYPGGFAAALSAACGAIGPIMPPSVLMIVYGAMTGTSVAWLFLGGVIPALLMGGYLMVVSFIIARKYGYGTVSKASAREVGRSFAKCLPTLVASLIIMGGIIGGVFTPTEAGAVAAIYLVAIGVMGRSLTWRDFIESVGSTARFVGQVLFIIAASASLGWILAVERVDQPIAAGLHALAGGEPLVLILLIALALIFVRLFVDAIPALTLLAPILHPIVERAGIDAVHFGVVATLCLTIGFLTPPVGVCMYMACAVGKVSIAEFLRHFWHIFLALIGVLLTIIVFPETVLFIPRLLLG